MNWKNGICYHCPFGHMKNRGRDFQFLTAFRRTRSGAPVFVEHKREFREYA